MPGVFLTDFGLARDTTTGSKFTRTGTTLGTPAYMSPEQARGELAALTPASDVWALGCVLYELLSGGRRAFPGDTPAAVIGAVLTTTPDIPSAVPGGVAIVLRVALQKAARHRHADAAVLAAECRRALAGDRPRLRPPTRRRTAWVVAALLALAGAGLLGYGRRGPSGPPAAQSEAEAAADAAWRLRGSDPGAAVQRYQRLLQQFPQRSDWRLRLGLLLWAIGRDTEAVSAWGAITPGDSQHPRARLYLALERYFRKAGNWDPDDESVWTELQAPAAEPGEVGTLAGGVAAYDIADARRLLGAVPGWEAALVLAMREQHLGDPDAALRYYDRALEEGIAFGWAHNNRGTLLNRADRPAEAMREFERAIALAPALAQPVFNRAALLIQMGDRDRGLPALDAAIRRWPNVAGGWSERARAYLDTDPRRALSDLNRSLELDGGRPEVWSDRGRVHQALGDLQAARADYEQALALDPRCTLALFNRAVLYEAQGDVRAALAEYDHLVDLQPEHHDARLNRGVLRRQAGDRDGALADFDRLLGGWPGDTAALVNRAGVYTDLGRYAQALADAQAALDIDAGYLPALQARVQAYIASGDTARALAACEAVLAKAPGDFLTLHNRGVLRMQAGAYPEAIADFEQALAARPGELFALINLGVCKREAKDLPGAIAAFETAVELHPREPLAVLNRGVARWAAGDPAAAERDLVRALELAPPDWPHRAAVEGHLATLRRVLGQGR